MKYNIKTPAAWSQSRSVYSIETISNSKAISEPLEMTESGLIGNSYTGYRVKDGALVAYNAKIPELGPHDVLVRITHSGVCSTDAVYLMLGAPIALGHEGVGVVDAVGSLVTKFKVGERAGAGFHRDACGHCKYCLSGKDIYCYERVIMGEGDFDNGTFGQYYIGKETFLHKIPDSISSEHAAPLQCAGATVYTALRATIKPEMRVGIFGIGGLGHLAIQYAARMGSEVVVYSTSESKEKEARGWGASEFHLISDMFEKMTVPLDVLIISGSHHPDWEKVMVKEFLARGGTIVPLNVNPLEPLTMNSLAMLTQGYQIRSSLVGSRLIHDEMLQFSARHNVKPLVQVSKLEDAGSVLKVFQDLEGNKVRYRAVLEV